MHNSRSFLRKLLLIKEYLMRIKNAENKFFENSRSVAEAIGISILVIYAS